MRTWVKRATAGRALWRHETWRATLDLREGEGRPNVVI